MIRPDLEGVKKTLEEYPYPVDIIVEVTRYCNLKCIMCPYPNLKRSKGHMEFATFKKIVDETARENQNARIWLAIMGEPLILGEKVATYIQYAKEQGVREVCLNTNAVFLTDKIADKLLSSGLDKLLVSIDAMTAEAYDKIRVGGNFGTGVQECRGLSSVEAKAGQTGGDHTIHSDGGERTRGRGIQGILVETWRDRQDPSQAGVGECHPIEYP